MTVPKIKLYHTDLCMFVHLRRVVGASGGQELPRLHGDLLLDGVEGLRPLRVSPCDLRVLLGLGVVLVARDDRSQGVGVGAEGEGMDGILRGQLTVHVAVDDRQVGRDGQVCAEEEVDGGRIFSAEKKILILKQPLYLANYIV